LQPCCPGGKRNDMKYGGIHIAKDLISAFCQQYHIRKLALFGSILREDFRTDSDIDVLVEFEPEHVPGFFELAHMERELSALLEGRRVDMRTPGDLSRYFRDHVVATAEVQYENERV